MKQWWKEIHIRRESVLRTLEKSVVLAFVLSLALSTLNFQGKCENISEKVLRLHILAKSDSDADQTLKLQVRDKILETAAGLVDGASDRQEAEKIVASRVPTLQKAAQEEVFAQGYDYSVRAELTEMYFTTRNYGEITLPAGKYHALRVTIGEGAGKNWWCVVYPPMCLAAAEKKESLDTVLTEEESEIVKGKPKFEIRFKVVEWWEAICDFFSPKEAKRA